jgi:hypothetical protein
MGGNLDVKEIIYTYQGPAPVRAPRTGDGA